VALQDVRYEDLLSDAGLQELYRQACAQGLAENGEAGLADFFALANRAVTRGHRPGALFMWLLKGRRLDFITQADEEAAWRRVRALRDGTRGEARSGFGGGGERSRPRQLTPEEQTVETVILTAKRLGIRDPFIVAQRVKGWSRETWEEACLRYQAAQCQRWRAADPGLGGEE
jgi:hypothetical protein